MVPRRAESKKKTEKTRTESREETKVRSRASEERSGAKSRLPGGVAEIPGGVAGGMIVDCAHAFSIDFKNIDVSAWEVTQNSKNRKT